jgi:hypothetical protein
MLKFMKIKREGKTQKLVKTQEFLVSNLSMMESRYPILDNIFHPIIWWNIISPHFYKRK